MAGIEMTHRNFNSIFNCPAEDNSLFHHANAKSETFSPLVYCFAFIFVCIKCCSPPAFFNWFYNIIARKSLMDSTANYMPTNSCFISPLGSGKSNSINCGKQIPSSVVRLGFHCSPSAIFFRVPFTIVNSVKSMFRGWLFTHVFKESRRIKPFIANGYPSSAIKLKLIIVRISASLNHPCPSSVFRCISHIMFFKTIMLNKTSTRFSLSRYDMLRHDNTIIPTFTNTVPVNSAVPVGCLINDSKLMKSFSRKVYNFTQNNILSDIAQMISVWQSALSAEFQVSPKPQGAL